MLPDIKEKVPARASEATKHSLQRSALYKEIQKECGYHLYEIEDVMNALSRVGTNCILNKRPIRLLHFCTIVPWTNKSKRSINPSTKEFMITKDSYTIKVVPANHLKSLLNPGEVQENQEGDE